MDLAGWRAENENQGAEKYVGNEMARLLTPTPSGVIDELDIIKTAVAEQVKSAITKKIQQSARKLVSHPFDPSLSSPITPVQCFLVVLVQTFL